VRSCNRRRRFEPSSRQATSPHDYEGFLKLPNEVCSGRILSSFAIDLGDARKRLRPKELDAARVPPVTKTLALADELRALFETESVNQSQLARSRTLAPMVLPKLSPSSDVSSRRPSCFAMCETLNFFREFARNSIVESHAFARSASSPCIINLERNHHELGNLLIEPPVQPVNENNPVQMQRAARRLTQALLLSRLVPASSKPACKAVHISAQSRPATVIGASADALVTIDMRISQEP
jgi:hypothetical protein